MKPDELFKKVGANIKTDTLHVPRTMEDHHVKHDSVIITDAIRGNRILIKSPKGVRVYKADEPTT